MLFKNKNAYLKIFLICLFLLIPKKVNADSASWSVSTYYSENCNDSGCAPAQTIDNAYFSASANNTYSPGESVGLSVMAVNASGYWHAPYVGISAYLGSSSGGAGASAPPSNPMYSTIYLTAPQVPGYYPISMTGCWYSGSNCASAAIGITVVCPSGTTWNGSSCVNQASVHVFFGFKEKLKDFILSISKLTLIKV